MFKNKSLLIKFFKHNASNLSWLEESVDSHNKFKMIFKELKRIKKEKANDLPPDKIMNLYQKLEDFVIHQIEITFPECIKSQTATGIMKDCLDFLGEPNRSEDLHILSAISCEAICWDFSLKSLKEWYSFRTIFEFAHTDAARHGRLKAEARTPR